MSGGLSRPDGPGLLNGSAKEQQFFRQGGFPGVGMTDDPEIAAAIHLSSMVSVQIQNLKVIFYNIKTGRIRPGFHYGVPQYND